MSDTARFLRRLDLTTLQIFVAIAEKQTLTRASEREGIAVSAASRRLVELERFLGVELFVRHAKGMTLTDVGRSLLVHSQRMLLNAATMSAELRDHLLRPSVQVFQAGEHGQWDRLRREFPGVYKTCVDMEPGKWMHLRLEVRGPKLRAYVNGAQQPTLVVNDLKLGDTKGMIALWIGVGAEAYFANLVIRPD